MKQYSPCIYFRIHQMKYIVLKEEKYITIKISAFDVLYSIVCYSKYNQFLINWNLLQSDNQMSNDTYCIHQYNCIPSRVSLADTLHLNQLIKIPSFLIDCTWLFFGNTVTLNVNYQYLFVIAKLSVRQTRYIIISYEY